MRDGRCPSRLPRLNSLPPPWKQSTPFRTAPSALLLPELLRLEANTGRGLWRLAKLGSEATGRMSQATKKLHPTRGRDRQFSDAVCRQATVRRSVAGHRFQIRHSAGKLNAGNRRRHHDPCSRRDRLVRHHSNFALYPISRRCSQSATEQAGVVPTQIRQSEEVRPSRWNQPPHLRLPAKARETSFVGSLRRTGAELFTGHVGAA